MDRLSWSIGQLLCVLEIPGLGLSPETGCPGRYCSLFSSLPPENCWNSSSKKVTSGVLHVLSSLSFTNHAVATATSAQWSYGRLIS